MTFDHRPIQSHRDPNSDDSEFRSQDHLHDQPALDVQDATSSDSELDASKADEKKSSMVREIVETLLLALIIFVAVRAVVLNFRVDGLSMNPSLENNEMLLVNRNVYFNFDTWSLVDWLPLVDHEEENVVYPFHPPERGDIIVFDPPVNGASQPYIKRVIGVPGETIEIQDSRVLVNGQEIEEPYLEGERTFCQGDRDCGPVIVPKESVFVLGDNRDNSQDSRIFGPVPVENIIGKAWVTYWPVDELGFTPHFEYPELDDN